VDTGALKQLVLHSVEELNETSKCDCQEGKQIRNKKTMFHFTGALKQLVLVMFEKFVHTHLRKLLLETQLDRLFYFNRILKIPLSEYARQSKRCKMVLIYKKKQQKRNFITYSLNGPN
jgi:hypothetical protein